ncbi:MAG: UvrD-helicase domain-containing protein, partial [Deltaproteobacteria bacterium]|nr:UvrD-helicase domain-containing protein [Deltaproteobacteria bacterium]
MMPWDPTEPLAERRTWLLEASAGTGKTYQIAGLYVRLVAELGIPVEKILAITFTQAATAELKDRIRTRLRLVRDALARPGTSGDSDPTVALLRALPAETHELHRRRLDLALLAFDEAAISTIHGFSQRSLAEFAFESGQDPALELMTSTVKLQEELVDDALALVHAGTNARQVALYEEAGLTRELLLRTAKELSAASVARIAPDVGTNEPLSLLPLLAERDARCQAHLEFFRTKRATLEADADHVNKQANLSKNLGAWEAFLSTGAELALPKYVPTTTWFRSKWKKGSPTIEERDWWSLATAVDDFVAKEAKFRREFLPLACFARGYRAALEARLDARAWLTFDGMLSRLAEGVERPGDPGSMLREKLAERYQAVFVDEFQDTDLAQWTVLRRAFHGRSRLFLIGDPKQAIYAFRGADVNVYLAAKHAVTTARAEGDGAGLVRTMAENWRSDRAAVSAMNHLWRAGSNAFDYPPSDVNEGMDYIEVAPSPKRRLEAPGTNDGAPVGFELRFLDGRLGRGNESAGTKLGRAQR